jgi:putative FmdB family regulatory protein
MAMYEYKCIHCGTSFTFVARVSEFEWRRKEAKCPQCGAKDAVQILSPAFVQASRKSQRQAVGP